MIIFYDKRLSKTSDNIELFVVTWVMDYSENLFIRYCNFSGIGFTWKSRNGRQLEILMQDIDISKEVIRGRLGFLDIESTKYLEI